MITSCKHFRETTDFHCKLNEIIHLVTPDSLLVTIGLNSLHTNIPHSDGVEACRSFLTMNITVQTLINEIPAFKCFIFKHNICLFADKKYLQINGASIGKNCTLEHRHFKTKRKLDDIERTSICE